MAISRRPRDGHNWRSLYLCPRFLVHSKLILYDRSLDDIGRRSLALSEKGKVARVLDKTRDSQEVIGLVEKLRQAILVYQVSLGGKKLSRSGFIDPLVRCLNNSRFTTRSSTWP